MDVTAFFDIENNQDPTYIRLSASELDSYIFLRISCPASHKGVVTLNAGAPPLKEVLSLSAGMIAFGAIIIVIGAAVVMFRKNERT